MTEKRVLESVIEARMIEIDSRSSRKMPSSSARHKRSDKAVAYVDRRKECLAADETNFQ